MQGEHLIIGRLEVVMPFVGLRFTQDSSLHQRLLDRTVLGVVFDLFTHELKYLVQQHTITCQVGGENDL